MKFRFILLQRKIAFVSVDLCAWLPCSSVASCALGTTVHSLCKLEESYQMRTASFFSRLSITACVSSFFYIFLHQFLTSFVLSHTTLSLPQILPKRFNSAPCFRSFLFVGFFPGLVTCFLFAVELRVVLALSPQM